MSPRDRRGGLDGVLVVAKPSGPTSHDVVGLVRRLSSTRRVGHGGTLDPFAAGVLPVFLGRATRLVEYHLSGSKRYRATICFGETSTTDDIDGDADAGRGARADSRGGRGRARRRSWVRCARCRPTSARSRSRAAGPTRWRAGARPSSWRRGTSIIHEATLLEWDGSDPARPIAVVDITCSAGTYIRALARDLGASLGSGAYLGCAGPDGLGWVPARGRDLVRDAARARGRRPGGDRAGAAPGRCRARGPAARRRDRGRGPPPRRGPDHGPQAPARGPRCAARAGRGPRRDDRRRLPCGHGCAPPAQGPRGASRRVRPSITPHRRATAGDAA